MNKQIALLLISVAAISDGCHSAPSPKLTLGRADFVRGCWMERKGDASRFLRLLPLGDELTYSGFITGVGDEPRLHYSFNRDGTMAHETVVTALVKPDHLARNPGTSYARIAGPAGMAGEEIAVYRRIDTSAEKLTVRASVDHLRISKSAGASGPEQIMFDGVRDGCD